MFKECNFMSVIMKRLIGLISIFLPKRLTLSSFIPNFIPIQTTVLKLNKYLKNLTGNHFLTLLVDRKIFAYFDGRKHFPNFEGMFTVYTVLLLGYVKKGFYEHQLPG